MAAIQLAGVTKRYGDVTALCGLDLTVAEGEVYGFLGPNGAGKSTTINVLLDFVRPTSGRARVLGHDCQAEPMAVRRRIGVLPEGFSVYERLTGRQHVAFACDSKGDSTSPDRLLERVGLSDDADRRAGDYSRGMRQRLALAMALSGDPDLLIMDEPTSGLDPTGARRMRELIRAERDRGTTVFFSSHVLDHVDAVCDRVGILDGGELVVEDAVENLRDRSGVDARLTVTVDGRATEAAARVRELEGVRAAVADGGSIEVTCRSGSKTHVLAAIYDAGATVVDFETDDPSIDDLFRTYTRTPTA